MLEHQENFINAVQYDSCEAQLGPSTWIVVSVSEQLNF